jgi:hypothetical protein
MMLPSACYMPSYLLRNAFYFSFKNYYFLICIGFLKIGCGTCLCIAATELRWFVQDKAIQLEILVWVGFGHEF